MALVFVTASTPVHTSVSAAEVSERDVRHYVIELVADYFGVEESYVTDETDFRRDLLADRADAYQVLAQACEAFGREVGEVSEITTVDDIIQYVLAAPPKPPEVRLRGGETDGPDGGALIKKVFFATDRRRTESDDPAHRFDGRRAAGPATLSFGYCEVSIPESHVAGELERPFLGWSDPDPQQHFELKVVEALDWNGFVAAINDTYANDTSIGATEALVFVHGYNVSFEKAAMRTAQVAHDLNFPGVPVLFTWPSDGNLLAYFSDREDAEWSALHFERLMADLQREGLFSGIHLVAHSMGSQVIIRALRRMALRRESTEPVFENVILAAPDFDAQTFVEQIAPEVRTLAKRWTVYTSNKDMALYASRLIRQNVAARLGEPLPLAEGVDTVDASGVEVSPWSLPEKHSYFATKQRVIADLKALLRGVGPLERQLRADTTGEGRYWRLLNE